MKLWKYNFYSELTQEITEGQTIKEPFIWADNLPDSDYSDVTTTEKILNKIKKNYKTFEFDGKNYFEDIRAKLVLSYQTGQKTEVEIFQIEALLNSTTDKIIRGDWLTAKNALESVVVSAPLDQSLYDEILLYITNYIGQNY